MKKLLAVAALSFTAVSALAQTTVVGAPSCGVWMNPTARIWARSWMFGYLSGWNMVSAR
jgi:hypothetical protein